MKLLLAVDWWCGQGVGHVRRWASMLGRPGRPQRLMGRRVQFTPRISKYGAQKEAEDGFVHLHHRTGMLSKIAPIMKQKQM